MATPLYYSVGQNSTDHKSGSPTVDIASGVAIFSEAQTASNLGVGDRVTYDTSSICYLVAKTSTTVWSVVTALGAAPTDCTGKTVNSIAHEYTSLNAAVNGCVDANHANSTNFITSDIIVNIPCYRDSANDTTQVSVPAITSDETRCIRMYCPTSTSTQCNTRQSHSGVLDTAKYFLYVNEVSIDTTTTSIIVESMQIDSHNSYRSNINVGGAAVFIKAKNCIMIQSNANHNGGSSVYLTGNTTNTKCVFVNNIVYGHTTAFTATGVVSRNLLIYNNTLCGSRKNGAAAGNGIDLGYSGGTTRIKNNICYDNEGNDFELGTTSGTKENVSNISEDNTSPNTAGRNKIITFVSASDFHLKQGSNAIGQASDLSADSYFAFSDDINGAARSGSWDCGADEATFATPWFLLSDKNELYNNIQMR